MSSKMVVLPRGLFIANQISLLGSELFCAGMAIRAQRRRHIAEMEAMNTLLMAQKIMDYADKSVMPQALIDEFDFRIIAALYDHKSDTTPEEEN